MTAIRKVVISAFGDPSNISIVSATLPPPPPSHAQVEILYAGLLRLRHKHAPGPIPHATKGAPHTGLLLRRHHQHPCRVLPKTQGRRYSRLPGIRRAIHLHQHAGNIPHPRARRSGPAESVRIGAGLEHGVRDGVPLRARLRGPEGVHPRLQRRGGVCLALHLQAPRRGRLRDVFGKKLRRRPSTRRHAIHVPEQRLDTRAAGPRGRGRGVRRPGLRELG